MTTEKAGINKRSGNISLNSLDQFPVPVFYLDKELRCLYCNAHASKLFGQRMELTNIRFDQITSPDPCILSGAVEAIKEGKPVVRVGMLSPDKKAEIPDKTIAFFLPDKDEAHGVHGLFAVILMTGTQGWKKDSHESVTCMRSECAPLQESLFMQPFIENCPAVILFKDTDKKLMLVNNAFASLFDLNKDSVIGKKDSDILSPEVVDIIRSYDEEVLENKRSFHFEQELKINDQLRSYFCIKFPLLKETVVYGTACIAADITERKYEEDKKQKQWEDIFRNTSIGLAVLTPDKNTFELMNPAFAEMHGYDVKELMNKPIVDVFAPAGLKVIPGCITSASLQGVCSSESMHKRKDGTSFPALISVTAVQNDHGVVLYRVLNVQDITDRKQAEEMIKYQAYHDLLTDLPNRELFVMYLNLEMTQARRNDYKIGIIFLDIDRFKNVNDSLGHSAGDKLIKEVAARIKSCIRKSDTLARVGGDEFAVLLSDVQRAEDVVINMREMMHAMNSPFRVDSHEFYITLSFGISMFPEDGEDPETLLKNADNAMFYAKETGRNSYHFFNQFLNTRTVEQLILENSLRKTIERDQLVLYYQPQISVMTRQITGVEALVRWRHPDLGLLKPEQFISLAEEMGFITHIDEWVLRAACAQARAWKDGGWKPIPVSVNMSARQFLNPDLIATVTKVLTETGVAPDYLELEITESIAMQNIEIAISNLVNLKKMGVSLSIDDFGTGFSSLSYLRRLPIRKLKIDKSFVKGIVSDASDQAIVNAVIAMGKSLNLEVIAEGVENEEQLEFLKTKQCDSIQGFLVSEPLPPSRFESLMQKQVA